jgi:hypothetical protein
VDACKLQTKKLLCSNSTVEFVPAQTQVHCIVTPAEYEYCTITCTCIPLQHYIDYPHVCNKYEYCGLSGGSNRWKSTDISSWEAFISTIVQLNLGNVSWYSPTWYDCNLADMSRHILTRECQHSTKVFVRIYAFVE